MKTLKKLIINVVAIICLATLGLTGCVLGNKNSIKVTAYVYDSVQEQFVDVATKSVDIYNNMILTKPDNIPPAGMEFYGWSTSQNWQAGSGDFVIKGNFISYNALKVITKKGEVKLYPAYKERTNYYFVFGVYTHTTTSGLGETDVANITSALKAYLASQGATAEQLALVDVREYADSSVGTYGAKIMGDGDVDVFVGCGNNINTTGGVAIVEKSAGFAINTKTGRRFVLLNYDDLSVAVYNWFQQYIHDTYDSTYTVVPVVPHTITYSLGEHASQDAVVPQQQSAYNNTQITLPEVPQTQEGYTFTGWRVGTELKNAGAQVTVTGNLNITAEYLKDYVDITYSFGEHVHESAIVPQAEHVQNGAQITLPEAPQAEDGYYFLGWRVGEDLLTAGTQINVTEDMNIVAEFGTGYAVTYSVGPNTRTTSSDPVALDNVAPGTLVTLPEAPTTRPGFVFDGWNVGLDSPMAAGSQVTVNGNMQITAQYSIDTTIDDADNDFVMKIAYLAYKPDTGSTSGLTNGDAHMTAMMEALNDYLADNGITFANLELVAYTDQASTSSSAINNVYQSEKIGIAIGFGGSVGYTANARRSNVKLGDKTGRYVDRLLDSKIANIVFDWMHSQEFDSVVANPGE